MAFTTSRLLLFCVVLLGVFDVSAQQFKWVQGGGTGQELRTSRYDEGAHYMCTDAHGNIYSLNVVGNDPITADTFIRPSGAFGASNNLLVTSYTCNGSMRWSKLIAGRGNSYPYGIAADSLGHLYVAGYFDNLGGYFSIVGDTVITSASYQTQGLIQFDTVGNFNWLRYVGDNSLGTLRGALAFRSTLAIDSSANVHFLNTMKYGVPYMPGFVSRRGMYDLVYNPSGDLLSGTRLELDSSLDIRGATIDKSTGKLYAYGNRAYEFPDSSHHSFIAAFNTSRALIWKDTLSNPIWNSGAFSGIAANNNGSIYLLGGGSAILVYRNDTVRNVSLSSADAVSFVLKIDEAGIPKWMIGYASTTSINAFNGIALMPDNKIAVAGVMGGRIVSGVDTIYSYTGEGQNSFLSILDTAGYVHEITQIHGNGFYDQALAIASDKAGNLYIGGSLEEDTWGGTITPYHTVGGNTDFYVMKYGMECSCTDMPIAAYSATGSHTLSVSYTGSTSGLDSVTWEFGDGGTARGTSATHTYTLAGTYFVCATAHTTCGRDVHCRDVVIACGLPPTASFTKTGSRILNVTYTGTTATVDSVEWKWGDGRRDTGRTATHTYTAVGIYTVCAIAWSACGNDTACAYDTVTCVAAPASAFTHTGVYPVNTVYTGSMTGIDSVGWNFGDGYRTRGLTASHTYAAIGTYTICATSHSPCGTNTSCTTVIIPCIAPPTATFTDTGSTTIGAAYTAGVVGLDSIGWNFGDGYRATGTAAIHTYTAAGTWHLCVTAYNPCGWDSACRDVYIPCVIPPVAAFTTTGDPTVTVTYTGTTTGIDSITWDFADGTTRTGTTVAHTYTASGTYNICVIAYTPCGNDTICNNVVVTVPNGLQQAGSKELVVLPNPTKEMIAVSGLKEQASYRLLSVTGVVLQQGTVSSVSAVMSLKDYASGIYVIELTAWDGERKYVRVVKE